MFGKIRCLKMKPTEKIIAKILEEKDYALVI
jgi:hypothetical protein